MCPEEGCFDGGVSSFPVSFSFGPGLFIVGSYFSLAGCKRAGYFLAVYPEQSRPISCFDRGEFVLD